MSLIDPSSEFILTNTSTRAGAIRLPSSFQAVGRILTIKDQNGAWGRNPLTVAVNNQNQTFEDGSFSTLMTTAGGWTTLISGDNNEWYTIGGTQLHAVQTSTIQASQIVTPNLSTGLMTMSTLILSDQLSASTNSLFTASTFLYYTRGNQQSSIIAGTRQATGFNLLRMRAPFQPNQVTNLNLWLDAADMNTIVVSDTKVKYWNDKSANNFNFSNLSLATCPQYSKTGFNEYYPTILFSTNFLARVNSGTLATTYTAFFVVQGNSIPVGNGGLIDAETGRFAMAHASFEGSIRPGVFNGFWTICPNIANTDPVIYSFVCATGGGLYINGTINATITSFPPIAMNGNVALGSRFSRDSAFLNAKLSEVVLYNTTVSDINRQKVEGYLAWKWGLVRNLPINHLYKNSPP